jgi:hypothetical protein
VEELDLVDLAAMRRDSGADHAVRVSLEGRELKDVNIAVEGSREHAVVYYGHVAKLREVEIVVRRRVLLSLLECERSLVKDIIGLDCVMDIELFPLDRIDQRGGHWIDRIRHLPDVVVPLLSLLDVDRQSILVLVDHLVVAQEVLLA